MGARVARSPGRTHPATVLRVSGANLPPHHRPAIQVEEDKSYFGAFDLSGRIYVQNPAGVRARLGEKLQNVTVEVVELPKPAPPVAEPVIEAETPAPEVTSE